MKQVLRLNNQGFSLPTTISFMIAMTIISAVLLQIIVMNFSTIGRQIERQKALNIAEAGINYYLWHLSHSPNDFKSGKDYPAVPDENLGYGPYEHDYIDDNAKKIGSYTLWIKPQGNGSTIATVRAIGKLTNSNLTRTVEAQIGATSFANYGLVSDTAIWFGSTESANGPVHSNQGIRMDGASSDNVTSANTTYMPPFSLGGDGQPKPGVWCSPTIITPINCNSRPKTDWRYPVPSVDFNQVNNSICSIKKTAFSNDSTTTNLANLPNACSLTPASRTASYLPQRSTTGNYNISRGYLIQLNPNNTYDLFNINGENDRNTPYTNALTLQTITTGIQIPTNGVIFAEDNVWVRTNPTFSGRVTIAAGRLATASSANIVIADDIVYGTKNGQDAIGLIAEDSIIIAPYAPPASGGFTFEVNAALLAQSGSVSYPSRYRSNPSRCTRGWTNSNQQFNFYGSVASRQTWTWTWLLGGSCGDASFASGKGWISGILNNDTAYDENLLYAPPPSYPITSGYNILTWREVLTNP